MYPCERFGLDVENVRENGQGESPKNEVVVDGCNKTTEGHTICAFVKVLLGCSGLIRYFKKELKRNNFDPLLIKIEKYLI